MLFFHFTALDNEAIIEFMNTLANSKEYVNEMALVDHIGMNLQL